MFRSLARHQVDRHAGQVAQHDPAVVGRRARAELGVGERPLVRRPDHREPEALRGLGPPEAGAVGDVADDLALGPLLGHQDRVARRDGHLDRHVPVERGHARAEDPRIEQRPRGVVEQHVALLVAERAQGPPGGLRAGRAPGHHPGDLRVAAGDPLGLRQEARGHHHDHLVDPRMAVEHVQGVLEDRLPRDLEKLLGGAGPDPLPDPAGEHHPDPAQPRFRDHVVLPGSRPYREVKRCR